MKTLPAQSVCLTDRQETLHTAQRVESSTGRGPIRKGEDIKNKQKTPFLFGGIEIRLSVTELRLSGVKIRLSGAKIRLSEIKLRLREIEVRLSENKIRSSEIKLRLSEIKM